MKKQRQIEEAAKLEGHEVRDGKINHYIPYRIQPIRYDIPDYLTDYNAVHRLIAGMSEVEGFRFISSLCSAFGILDGDHLISNGGEPESWAVSLMEANCAQMLEAILKAHCVWEEGE